MFNSSALIDRLRLKSQYEKITVYIRVSKDSELQ